MSELLVREAVAQYINEFAGERGLKFLYIEYDGKYPYDLDDDAEAEWKPVKPEEYASEKRGRSALWMLYFPEKTCSDDIPLSETIAVSLCEEANALRVSADNMCYKFPSNGKAVDNIKLPLKRIVDLLTIPPMHACPIKHFYQYDLRRREND